MKRYGSFPASISPIKDAIDFWLTRFPRAYLYFDRFRDWINWDKRLYLSLIEPGSVVLDIGANIGTHTVMFSHLVGKSGRVLSFEPVPASFERLVENLEKRSRFANVTTFQLAVGNPASNREEAVMRIPGDDLTQASLRIQIGDAWGNRSDPREYTCSLTSIDAQLSEAPTSHLEFVKIDVEGGELDALKGAERTLLRHHPLVYCEVYEKWTSAFGYTPAQLFAFVGSLGYVGARVIREGEVHPLVLGDYKSGLFDVSSNVLFFADKHAQLMDSFDKRFNVGAS